MNYKLPFILSALLAVVLCASEQKNVGIPINADANWKAAELYLSANINLKSDITKGNDGDDIKSWQYADEFYDIAFDSEKRLEKNYIEKFISAPANKDANYAKQLLEFYKMIPGKPRHDIVCQIKMDDRRLFIVNLSSLAKDGETVNTMVYLVICRNANSHFIAAPTNIEQLLYYALQRNNKLDIITKDISKDTRLHHIRLVDCKDEKDNVTIHFAGEYIPEIKLTKDLKKETIVTENSRDIIDFIGKMNRDFENEPMLECINKYYTESSAQNYRKYIEQLDAQALSKYRDKMLKTTYNIHYIMNIAPFFIVFYKNDSNAIIPFKHHTAYYQYLYCVKINGKYKITNDILKDNFIDMLIKEHLLDMDGVIEKDKKTYLKNKNNQKSLEK